MQEKRTGAVYLGDAHPCQKDFLETSSFYTEKHTPPRQIFFQIYLYRFYELTSLAIWTIF